MNIKSALAVSALVASAALTLTGCAGASEASPATPAAAVEASAAPVATATPTATPTAAQATPTASYNAADLEKYKVDPNLVNTIHGMTNCDQVRTVIYSLMGTINDTKTTGDKAAGTKALLTLAAAGNKAKELDCPGANN